MRNQYEISQAYDDGRFLFRTFSKNITVSTTVGIHLDLSGVSGNPIAQYFLGASGESTSLTYTNNDKGIDHGGVMEGYRKFLHMLNVRTVTTNLAPMEICLCDYLLFYPFIGMDTGLQELTNVESYTRYEAREGVQMIMVEQNPYIGNVTCQIGYTNQDGVEGRLTPVITINTAVVAGTIATSAPTTEGVTGCYVPLQMGDYGVQKVDTIEFFSGDVGTVAICLVKPIATVATYETTAPSENDLWFHMGQLPEIKNDAYLNLIVKPSATVTGAVSNTIFGEIKTLWKEE